MAYKYNPLLPAGLDQVSAGGGGGTPGGADTQVQFNDGGAFGGDAGLTYNKTTDELTVAGDINLDDGGTFSTTVQSVTPTANRTISFPDATGTVALVAGSSGQVTYNNAGAQAGFNGLTIDGSGNLSGGGVGTTSPAVAWDVVGQVRASTGILFGTDTAAANALDDYEEGTWTPSLVFATSGSVTLGGAEGYYTKIGRQVFVHCIIRVLSLSSPTGFAVIEGLPFAANTDGTFPQYMNIGNITNSHDIVGNINPDSTITANQSTSINLFKDVEQTVRLDGADIVGGGSGTAIRICMSYTV